MNSSVKSGAFLTGESMKMFIYVASVIISIMLFYGAIDKRVIILETKEKNKIEREELYEKLEDFKNDINTKIENEVNKLKEEIRNGRKR